VQRHQTNARPDFKQRLEQVGINYHTHDNGEPYWYEGAYYAFSTGEIDRLEAATNELQGMCIEAVGHVIEHRDFEAFRIPKEFWPLIEQSWEQDEVSIYGRFDFAYAPDGTIKLLEYNADTPTSLVEASIGQWHWLNDTHKLDQWNSLHERLIEAWKRARATYSLNGEIHFLGLDTAEDWQTITYMRDVAKQAGWRTHQSNLLDLGWDQSRGAFVTLDELPVHTAFKLYPWEHMVREQFGQHLQTNPCRFLEPAWKMLLSNKAILAQLWKMYPGHSLLLPSYLDNWQGQSNRFVSKPIFGREGANVQIFSEQGLVMQGEDQKYGAEGLIYQELATLHQIECEHGTVTPVLGAWVVDGEAAGLGIRESSRFITDNRSRFVPHLIC
jgi:glutathionylspermidine synthase